MSDILKFTPNKNSNMLWRYFAPLIQNKFGTAGLVAGLYLRSGCDSYTGYMNYIVEDPLKIDMKTFVHDKKGYGIGKWKNWSRKQSLYNFCRKAGTPIYDIASQADFVMDEFSGTTYGPVLKELSDAVSVKEAAYLVYDRYLDIKKRDDEKREICAEIAMDIYLLYGEPIELKTPVKYVQSIKSRICVRGRKGNKFQLIRKILGYLKPGELYRFVTVSDDGKEYALYFNDEIGYVNSEKTHIVTKMEAIK